MQHRRAGIVVSVLILGLICGPCRAGDADDDTATSIACVIERHCSADDPQSIEEGEPVTIEDAWADPPGLVSLQYSQIFVSEHGPETVRLFQGGPTVKFGALPGLQLSFNPTYQIGIGAQRDQGYATPDALIQFNRQGAYLPAFAVDLFYSVPYGAGQLSPVYTARFIASKSLGPSDASPRLHLNLTDYHLTQHGDGRSDQLELAFGASMLLNRETSLVTDIVRGAQEVPRYSQTSLEIGLIRDLPDDWNATLGVGRQVQGRGDIWRILFSFEKELKVF